MLLVQKKMAMCQNFFNVLKLNWHFNRSLFESHCPSVFDPKTHFPSSLWVKNHFGSQDTHYQDPFQSDFDSFQQCISRINNHSKNAIKHDYNDDSKTAKCQQYTRNNIHTNETNNSNSNTNNQKSSNAPINSISYETLPKPWQQQDRFFRCTSQYPLDHGWARIIVESFVRVHT